MESKWHTRKWFLENFGVDPLTLSIPPKEVRNPYYSRAAPMKLWKEGDILPYKSEHGIQGYAKRRQAGHKAYETRKHRLIEWWKQVKTENPRVQEIVKRLWVIGEEISKLHEEKEECRGSQDREAHWEFGEEHCQDCAEKTEAQQALRAERERLFMGLERVCEKEKDTIQLARRYYRLEGNQEREVRCEG